MLKVLDVDGAVHRVSGGWEPTGQPWSYDAERYARVAAERSREQQAMLDYASAGGCRMEYLRRELDDPAAGPCGRCDNCTGRHRAADVSGAGAATARERLLRPGVDVAPRRMWPAGMKDLGIGASGKIPPQACAGPGRALGRLTDVGWGTRLRALLSGEAPDEPVTADLTGALVTVLAAWDWEQRPAAVATLPSRTRPLLIESLGQRIAGIGRLRLPRRAGVRGRRARAAAAQQRAAAAVAVGGVHGPRDTRRCAARPGRPGPAHRRPDRDGLDGHGRRQAAPRGGRPGRAAPRAGGEHRLTARERPLTGTRPTRVQRAARLPSQRRGNAGLPGSAWPRRHLSGGRSPRAGCTAPRADASRPRSGPVPRRRVRPRGGRAGGENLVRPRREGHPIR